MPEPTPAELSAIKAEMADYDRYLSIQEVLDMLADVERWALQELMGTNLQALKASRVNSDPL